MENLYKEILEQIKIKDIDYITIGNKEIDKKWFLKQAKRINYDSGFGGEVINLNLIIVLKDGSWLDRREYDGSEWFELNKCSKKKTKVSKPDLGLLFNNNHSCPHNETIIDKTSISERPFASEKYSIWLEKNGKIIIEQHEWDNGNYKKEHKKLTN